MRVPFPLALRVGTDIVATSRFLSPHEPDTRRLIKLTNRFLLPQELDDLARRFPSWKNAHADKRLRTQVAAWIAGRWAAKEAAKKAWDASILGFRDLRIEADSTGAVHIVCDTRLTTTRSTHQSVSPAAKVSEQVAQLSISHDGDYTLATVLATPLHPDIKSELQHRKAEAEAKLLPAVT